MESNRRPPALHFLGTFRHGETVELTQRSTSLGSHPSCDWVVSHDEPSSPLEWQILCGRQDVAVRNWSGHGELNGAPFSSSLLRHGDRLQLGDLEVQLVADHVAPDKESGCQESGCQESVEQETAPPADVPTEQPFEPAPPQSAPSASTAADTREREWLRRRLHSLALQVRKNQHDNRLAFQEQKLARPAWLDDVLNDQRAALESLRIDVNAARAQIAELETRWDTTQSQPLPPVTGQPEALSQLLDSHHFEGITNRDQLSVETALELVASRLDQLQTERDSFESLCQELSEKIGTLEDEFTEQAEQLSELRSDLSDAIVELKALRAQVTAQEQQAIAASETREAERLAQAEALRLEIEVQERTEALRREAEQQETLRREAEQQETLRREAEQQEVRRLEALRCEQEALALAQQQAELRESAEEQAALRRFAEQVLPVASPSTAEPQAAPPSDASFGRGGPVSPVAMTVISPIGGFDLGHDLPNPLPVHHSAQLSSLIDEMEQDVDEFMHIQSTGDSICIPRKVDSTTRSFIEDARLLPELPALEDDEIEDYQSEWKASTVLSPSDDTSRTMLVDVPIDDEGPLEPLAAEVAPAAKKSASMRDVDDFSDDDYGAPAYSSQLDEAPEFYTPSEAPPVSAASILGALGALPDDFESQVAATATVAPVERHLPMPPADEDSSIAQYMEQLLQRLGGATASAQSAFAPAPRVANERPSTVSPSVAEVEQEIRRLTQQMDVREHLESAQSANAHRESRLTQTNNDMISLDSADGMRRRTVPPELHSDWSAMRELANVSARTAIDRHVKQRWGYAAIGKLSVCLAALVTGFGLTLVARSWASIATLGAGASYIIATFWGYQAVQLFRLVAAAHAHAKQIAAEEEATATDGFDA